MYPGSDIWGRVSLEIPSMVLGYPALYVTPKVRAWGASFLETSHIFNRFASAPCWCIFWRARGTRAPTFSDCSI